MNLIKHQCATIHFVYLSQKSLEPVIGGVSSRVSQLWSMVPTEYAVPVVLLGAGLLVSRVGGREGGMDFNHHCLAS